LFCGNDQSHACVIFNDVSLYVVLRYCSEMTPVFGRNSRMQILQLSINKSSKTAQVTAQTLNTQNYHVIIVFAKVR